jgi:hypothetical protein
VQRAGANLGHKNSGALSDKSVLVVRAFAGEGARATFGRTALSYRSVRPTFESGNEEPLGRAALFGAGIGMERGGGGGPGVVGVGHRDVDVFEDLAWGDALEAVGGFDEVVAFLAAMLAAERVGEDKRFLELTGFDQKTSAVDGPIGGTAHGVSLASLRLAAASFQVLAFGLRPLGTAVSFQLSAQAVGSGRNL